MTSALEEGVAVEHYEGVRVLSLTADQIDRIVDPFVNRRNVSQVR